MNHIQNEAYCANRVYIGQMLACIAAFVIAVSIACLKLVDAACAQEPYGVSGLEKHLTTHAVSADTRYASVPDGVYTISCRSKLIAVEDGSKSNSAAMNLEISAMTPNQRWLIESIGEGCYRIRSVSTGKALTVSVKAQSGGTVLRQRAYTGAETQKWMFKVEKDGSYAIVPALFPAYALGVQGSLAKGARVRVFAQTNSAVRAWSLKRIEPAIKEGYYIFENVKSGKVLDIEGASFENGANLQQYEANGTLAQTFRVTFDESTGYYEMRCAASGNLVDVEGASLANGANVHQYEANGTLAQEWAMKKASDGSIIIRSALNGKALSVAGASKDDMANVRMQNSKGYTHQRWRARLNKRWIPDGTYYISSAKSSDKMLDIAGASQKSGANAHLYSGNETNAQRFYIRSVGGGAYTIQNTYSGKYLDAASNKARSNVRQTTTREKWIPVLTNYGISFRLKKKPSLALELAGGKAQDSTNVRIGSNTGKISQKWLLSRTQMLSDGLYEIATAKSGYALSAPKAKSGSLKVQSRSGASSQMFELRNVSGNAYRITSLSTDRALRANATGSENDASISMASKADSTRQYWEPKLGKDGSIALIAKAGGGKGSLTVVGSKAAAGAVVKVSAYDARSTQKWRVVISSNSYNETLSITLDQMVSWNWNGNSYNREYLGSVAALRDVLDPNNCDQLQFADLRKTTSTTASQLDAFIATNGSNGMLAGMGSAFVAAAKKYGLNQDYLLAHAILESGWGTSELARGYYFGGGTIDGVYYPAGTYYNFYGIGAYDSSPLSGGRKLAIINGWNTRKRAIYGAAKWISENYTYRSYTPQYTLYGMKWDYLASNATKAYGWHQYATGGTWAGSIARIMGNIYSSTGTGGSLAYVVLKYK